MTNGATVSAKRCTKCGDVKVLEAFHASTRAADGKHPNCKQCRRALDESKREHLKAYRRAHFVKNRAKEVAQMERWRAGNAERKSASDRHWRNANILDIRERKRAYRKTHREESAARVRKFHKLNPQKLRAWQAGARARRASAPGRGVSATDWLSILGDSLGLCVYCNNRTKMSIDNIAAACLPCNMSKNDKPLLVWLAQRAA